MERFIRLFGHDCIDCLVADRESSARSGLDGLTTTGFDTISVFGRILGLSSPPQEKESERGGSSIPLKSDRRNSTTSSFCIKGQYVYLAGSRIKNSDGIPELQILICFNRPEDGVATYKNAGRLKRIPCHESSGFNIEDTHLRDRVRIARLFAMVCMALVWAYLVGEHKDIYVKTDKILKHGRRAKSLVKYGLEEISNVLFRPTYTPKFDVFKFLSCT